MSWIRRFLGLSGLLCLLSCGVRAQSVEVQQLLLNVEKLSQLKNILADMKKGYTIVSGGYNAIKNIAQGNFSLHEVFLDGLMLVSLEVRKYRRVGDIIRYQQALLSEYKSAYRRFRQQDSFSPKELDYLGRVYAQLTTQSMDNLDELLMVITSSQLRMSDEQRLAAIDRIFLSMEEKLDFLRSFNRQALMLSSARAKEQADIRASRNLQFKESMYDQE